MRAHGCINKAGGLGTDAHACWAFDHRQDFVDASLEFLTDGLRSGQRLAYVSSEPAAEQRERLEALGDVGGMIDGGRLQLLALGDLYEVGRPVDAAAQVSVYIAAAEAARADGYSGLRVVAEVTELVAEPETWDAHARWESTADRVLSRYPLAGMCGYERGALPAQLLADLAALHPAANEAAGPAPFHLFGEDGGLVLSGEVDLFSSEALDRALAFACDTDGPISLDLDALEFIDHHGIEVLAAHTNRLASTGGCEVHNAPPVVERLCELLDLRL